MRRIRPLYRLLIGISSFFVFFIASTQKAYAFCVPWFTNGFCIGSVIDKAITNVAIGLVQAAVSLITGFINTIVGAFAWLSFQVAKWLINIALLANSQIANSSVIKFGFNQVLDIANLALIVAIVAIAFMVMLRRAEASKLLIRFVLVAVFVNFGFLVTTHFLIEPVDSVTSSLVRATNFSPGTFGSSFTPDIDLSSLYEGAGNGISVVDPPDYLSGDPTNEDEFLPGLTYAILVGFASIAFSVAFLVMGSVALFSFAGMLFVRYIALGILIILMPIAWVSWIFPNLKMPGGHPFSQWWEQFIRWLLFGPVAMFFFWLSVKASNMDAMPTTSVDIADSGWSSALAEAAAVVGDMIIIIGLMIGGLLVANKMGITGARAGIAGAKKVGNWAKGKGKEYAIRGATSPLRTERGRRWTEAAQRTGQNRNVFLRTVSAPLRRAGTGAASFRQRGEAIYAQRKRAVSRMKLEEQVRQTSTMDAPSRLAVLTNLREARYSADAKLRQAEERLEIAQEHWDQTHTHPDEAERARLEADVAHRTAQHDEVERLIDQIPDRVADSFRGLERSYGEHETPLMRTKPKKPKEGEPEFEPVKTDKD